MENTKKRIAETISRKATDGILSAIQPLNVLTAAVAEYGKPVMCYDNMFDPDPEGRDNRFLAFELYLDPTACNGMGRLIVVETSSKSGALIESGVDEYVAANDIEEGYNPFTARLVNHFMNVMGMDFNETRDKIIEEIAKNLLSDLPKSVLENVLAEYNAQAFTEKCKAKGLLD